MFAIANYKGNEPRIFSSEITRCHLNKINDINILTVNGVKFGICLEPDAFSGNTIPHGERPQTKLTSGFMLRDRFASEHVCSCTAAKMKSALARIEGFGLYW